MRPSTQRLDRRDSFWRTLVSTQYQPKIPRVYASPVSSILPFDYSFHLLSESSLLLRTLSRGFGELCRFRPGGCVLFDHDVGRRALVERSHSCRVALLVS